MYVYIKSEPQLWTVGFYTPDGKWNSESDWDVRQDAAKRVAWLNGTTEFNNYPDAEADRYVFCGKCGKAKTI